MPQSVTFLYQVYFYFSIASLSYDLPLFFDDATWEPKPVLVRTILVFVKAEVNLGRWYQNLS